MKPLILITLAIVAASSSFAQKVKNDTISIQTKIYCDHCKQCESCQPHIERELAFTKGVKSSTVNIQNQTITVIYNPKKTSPQAIKQAIANSGYNADEVKATPKAIAKLDDCCKRIKQQ